LILSDIPYGIGAEEWDVLHNNTNSAYLGSSPAQKKSGDIFKKRGKPLNGWSESDRLIPKQYYDWVSSWADNWLRILKPGGSAFVFAGRRLSHRCITAFEDAGFTFKDSIAWDKEKAPHRAQRVSVVYKNRQDYISEEKWEGWKVGNLRPVYEPILWFTKPYKIGGTIADNLLEHSVGAYNESILLNYNLLPNNIFRISSQKADKGLHPTQKPLKLMKLLIELTTIEGQIILDPFCGSGTTLLASLQLGRKYIGIEKDEKYFDVAKQRINDYQKQHSLDIFNL
jgi:site-specific DNA-methyltransferase (adenine-specific)